MKKSLLITLALILNSGVSLARTDGPKVLTVPLTATLSGSTMAAARTITIASNQLNGLSLLTLYYWLYDANDSITAFSVACQGLHTSGGHQAYNIPSCFYDSTNVRWNCEAAPFYWIPSDETASDWKTNIQRLDVAGLSNVTCTVTPTGGAAADTLEVIAIGSTD